MKFKKLFSVLLAMLMIVSVISSMPAEVFADYEDGQECWQCGHYHWDDHMCGMCGACSDSCTDDDCHNRTHCEWCGQCLMDCFWCDTSFLCMDCLVEDGWHCPECYDCYCGDNDELCSVCYRCDGCAGTICDECGMCEECASTEGDAFHCVECGACIMSTEFCDKGSGNSDHCVDCHEICDQCDRCSIDDDLEFCDYCGLCTECCEENIMTWGCDCGEYCIEDSAFEEHLCPSCGTCYDECEQCEYCELCLDCCEENSDCSEGMCIEDPEYEIHFCEECGDCFDESEQCEECELYGNYRCRDCCEHICYYEGCDCIGWCSSDPGFEDHLEYYHGNSEAFSHSVAVPKSRYTFNSVRHWKECSYCDAVNHRTGIGYHDLDSTGKCTVCDYRADTDLYVARQPVDFTGKVTDPDNDYPEDRIATFSVVAYGTGNLTYQWYRCRSNGQITSKLSDDYTYVWGAQSNRLKVNIPEDACEDPYYFICEIKDSKSTVKTAVAALYGDHNYSWRNDYGSKLNTIKLKNGSVCQWYDSYGHTRRCNCGAERGKMQDHCFATSVYMGFDKSGREWMKHTCKDCGYVEYYEKHDHYYTDFEISEPDTDAGFHAIKCSYPGCDHITYEIHSYFPHVVSTPFTSYSGRGAYNLECTDCGYLTETQAPADESGYWTSSNYLGYARDARVSKSVFKNTDTLTLNVNLLRYWDRVIGIATVDKKITGWKATCYYGTYASTEMDATSYFTFTKLPDGNWTAKMKTNLNKGGSKIYFEPVYSTCNHTSTTVVNYRAGVCCIAGYTGDTVCSDCGKLVKTGNPIPAPSNKHTGTLTLIPGTARAGSCYERGYEGDFRCSKCNNVVKGKSTGYNHSGYTSSPSGFKDATCTEEGYSADFYCNNCHKMTKRGHATKPFHGMTATINAKDATYDEPGYTGDTYCYICQQIVETGHAIPALKPTTLTSVKMTMNVPIVGSSASSVTARSRVEFAPSHTTITASKWTTSNRTTTFTGTFALGTLYYAAYTIKPDSGYAFGNKTTFTVNGQQCYTETQSGGAVTVYYPFYVNQAVKTVYLYMDIPTEGDVANKPPAISSCSAGAVPFVNSNWKNHWYDAPDKSFSGTFEAGKTYYATLSFNPAPGYGFESYSNMKVVFNGAEYPVKWAPGIAYYTNVEFTVDDHQWDDGTYYTLPTADRAGEKICTCDVCGTVQSTTVNSIAHSGWFLNNNDWYYIIGGLAITGWKSFSNSWYYFDDNGKMQKGWAQVNNVWYYFNADGVMQTGWQKISNAWYYFASSGSMQTGWQKISNVWYYFASSGAMVTGWQQISNVWYYFASSGAMVTGWQQISNVWYYFASSGAMVTGWQLIGGVWYYFESSGAMLANTSKKIGGKTYYFNSSGACTNP